MLSFRHQSSSVSQLYCLRTRLNFVCTVHVSVEIWWCFVFTAIWVNFLFLPLCSSSPLPHYHHRPSENDFSFLALNNPFIFLKCYQNSTIFINKRIDLFLRASSYKLPIAILLLSPQIKIHIGNFKKHYISDMV